MQCVYLLLLQTLGLYLRSQVLVLRMVSDGVDPGDSEKAGW